MVEYGIKALRVAQLGMETTAGTAVAATTVWRGEAGDITDESDIRSVAVDDGNFIPAHNQYEASVGATWAPPETEATFENITYILAGSIENITSGTVDTGGSGYIYQYDVNTSSAQTPKTFTVEVGNNVQAFEVEYSFVEEWSLTGAQQEPLMIAPTWRGRQKQKATFTAGQSVIASQEEILFSMGTLYLDDTTIGNEAQANVWLGFSMTVNPGVQAIWTGDGAATPYFSTIKKIMPEITGEITLEHDDTYGSDEYDAADAQQLRYMRMLFEGSALTTAGSSYSNKTFQFDASIEYTDVPSVEETDGDDTITLPWRAVQGNDPQFIVVNEQSALT